MSIRRLILPLTLAAIAIGPADVRAQGAFPAPLPGQAAASGAAPFPPVNAAAPSASVGGGSFPVNGAAPIGAAPMGGGMMGGPQPQAGGPPDTCMKDFIPLRQEAEKRGKLIKAASDRHATPDEACKLIKSFGQAETKMISFVESHMAKCGIPPQVADQLKNGHKNTEGMQTKVCAVAAQPHGPAGPSLSEVLGSAAAVPEATASRKGGSTFDTLNGNVLAR